MLHKPKIVTPTTSIPRARHWLSRPENHAKINMDASVARAGGFGAVSVICRDHTRTYQGASAVVFSYIDDPTILKTLAIKETLALVEDLYL